MDERAALEDRLEYQRTTLLLKCGGLTDGFGDISVNRAADDLASYQASVARSRQAVRERGLDEAIPGEDYTLRWIYLHMIEEYARHNGHADLLRERIDGATGE